LTLVIFALGILLGLLSRNAFVVAFTSGASLPLFLCLGWMLSRPPTTAMSGIYRGGMWYAAFTSAAVIGLLIAITWELIKRSRTPHPSA